MPPLETPSPKSPTAQPPADEPRSRKPSRARVHFVPPVTAATPPAGADVPPAIEIYWSAPATRSLNDAHKPSPKRALNLVARQAIARTLAAATPLFPALQNQIAEIQNPSWQIDLSFGDDPSIQGLNANHRGKDKPTDVLSFPVWEGDFVFPLPPGETTIMLGDMVISIDTAMRQATELKHDLRAEIAFLAAHGTLHLLGYDHGTDGERRRMFALQDEIVAQLREVKGF